MSRSLKLNSVLISLTLFGIVFFLYLCIYAQTMTFDMANSIFLAAAVGGSFCIYADIFYKDSDRVLYWMGWMTSIFILLIIELFTNLFFVILSLWMLGAIHLISHILCEQKNQTKIMIINCCVYISVPLFIIISNNFLAFSGLTRPLVYDQFLMAIDGTLGFYPNLVLGRFFSELPGFISSLILAIYLALPTAIILIYLKRLNYAIEPPYSFMIEVIFIGFLGFSLYNIIPGCGAIPSFNTWPQSLSPGFLQNSPQLISCPSSFPRNALPSLHTAWIICLLRQAWLCNKEVKVLASIFAFGTVIAMFGVGHYLIDLIVGFSFANFTGGLCAFHLNWKSKARLQAILLGGLLSLSWYLIIFYGIPVLQSSKILAWTLFLASTFLSLYLEFRLFKGSKSQSGDYSRGENVPEFAV
ncbi:MAG: phosphatase PAP2 family protein [Tatlockia sp.]|nr:phosphatase PAP2 family protein [Tatlockia sp.]